MYGLTKHRQALLGSDALVLHPGPINRGVELDSEVADGQNNVILNQVEYGVYIRMALLGHVDGGLVVGIAIVNGKYFEIQMIHLMFVI